MTKGVPYCTLAVASLAIMGGYFYYDSCCSLTKFGKEFTERLCDMLPQKEGQKPAPATPTSEPPVTATPPVVQNLSKESIYNPKVTNGAVYNAKKAIDARYRKMKEFCHKYNDVMRPEVMLVKNEDLKLEHFHLHPSSSVVICKIHGVAYKSYHALFERIRSGNDQSETSYIHKFKEGFPKTLAEKKRFMMVRHPMERLISIYREHYASDRKEFMPPIDPKTGKPKVNEGEQEISFADFIYLVVEGPIELSEFIEENKLHGQSLGIDTGMVDGKGKSKLWQSYWKQCGVCHPDFSPHFILHMEHYKEDEEVMVEMLGNQDGAKKWIDVEHNHVASTREAHEYFYSQITKDDIRKIYDKYRVDFELFGYTPDYFLQFGQGE